MRTAALVVSLAFAVSIAACGDNLPGNAPPDVADRSAATPEDTPVTINVVAEDPEGAALTFTYSQPANGMLTGTGAAITYRPDDDYHGPDSFTVTVSDGANSAEARIAITVMPVNDAPVAGDDALAADEDTAATVDVATLLQNDTDVDGDTLSVTALGTPSSGTAALDAGVVTYTPADNFTGTATFTYTLSDGNGGMDTGEVTVTVGGENDPPVAVDDTVTTAEDTVLDIPSTMLTANDTDADGQALSVTMITGVPVGGTAVLAGGTITFTPAANFNGTGGFDYVVSDGADTDTGHVTVTVTPVNDPPVATAGTATTAEDTGVTVTIAATDVDGQPLTFAVAMMPASGTLGAISQLTPTTASVTYTPSANFNGGDSFTFTASDGTATSAPAAVMITVTPVNDGPVAAGQNTTCPEDTTCTITLAGTDVDGDPLTFAIAGGPSSGTLGPVTQVTPTTATVTYRGNSNSTADDAFTFTVNDGTVPSTPATVNVDVTPVNDPPIAVNDSDTVERNTPRTQPFAFYLGNDNDGGDGGPLTITVVDMAINGTVAITAGNTITFTPAANYTGPASFRYTLSDGIDTTFGAVSLTVVLTNTPIVAVDDLGLMTDEDTDLVRDASVFTANDIDPDPQPRTILSVQDAQNGTVDLTGTTVTFTPTANYNGPAQFTYTVSDGFSSSTATVSITVNPVNDAPDAVDDTATVAEDGSVGVPVLVNDSNDDGPLTISAFTQGSNGTVTQTLNTLTYAPNPNFNGTDTFTYTAQDSGSLTDTATVTVTVTPVNDQPIMVDREDTIPENAAYTINLAATDVDVPAQQLTFTVSNPPDFGTLGPITTTGLTTATVVYTPNPNYVGDDFMHFTVSDGAASDLGIVVLHVTNVVVCGDGQIEAPETCDDNDAVGGDGCSATCQVETGWSCIGQPSACDTICGDTIVIAGEEECDDGNGIDTDGCTTQCQTGAECSLGFPALAGGDRFVTDPATGHCYVSFDDDQQTFASAQTACIAAGGHLASITSSAEQALVASIHNVLQNPWIGLTDELVEGSFGWITGEAMSFNGFATGQPDGGGPEDCVNLFAAAIAPPGETSRWNDTSCTFIGFVQGRICELDADACGDGVLHTARSETCDDGNRVPGDGCGATCQVEAGAVCSGTAPTTCSRLVINEIDYDQPGTDNTNGQFEFVEILSKGTAPADVTSVALVLLNGGGASTTEYFFDGTTGMSNIAKRIALSGAGVPGNLLAPGQMIVIGPAGLTSTVPSGVFTITVVPAAAGMIQNGAPDAVTLFNVVTNSVVDTVSYEGNSPAATILGAPGTYTVTEVAGAPADPAGTGAPNESIQRHPNGTDAGNNSTDFKLRPSTPGLPSPVL